MDRQHALMIMQTVLRLGRTRASRKFGRNKIMHALHYLRRELNGMGA